MNKKQKIFWLGIVIPILGAYTYNQLFQYSANWFEDNQNAIKIILMLFSILCSFWLLSVSYRENVKIWITFSLFVAILLLVYFYLNISLINISIG